ncbi:MAG: zf-HC2 domain-containing protein [Gemmatimonadaceae bacterium]|nr:zf-HC2 domain-containing protein [Gemmatimonadaceae bacterium]
MNCRDFRRKHDAYIDDTLCGNDLDGMSQHLRFCASCSSLDTRVRRALLLAHNIPSIRPSAAFHDRLVARLEAERRSMNEMRATSAREAESRWRPLSIGGYSVMAAGVLVAAGLASFVVHAASAKATALRLPPVVATRPESEPSPLATPTMVASMSAGMPVWPAVFVAQQAPWHFANTAAGR